MGNRDVPGTFWPGHNQHDQSISHNDGMQQHMHFGYAGTSGPNRTTYPVDNRFTSQVHIHPNWSHSSVSGGYSYTHQNNGLQNHQPNGAPPYHPYPPLTAVPAFPCSHMYPSSSSSNDPPGFYQNGLSYDDLRMGGRGSSKRKISPVPFGGEREHTNRLGAAGSSSIGHMHPNFVQGKSNLDNTHQWEHHAMSTSSSSSGSRLVRDEGATRNVRRRYAYNAESGLSAPGVSVPFEHPVIHPSGYFGSLNPTHCTSGGADPSWRHSHVPSAATGMMPVADLSNSHQGNNLAFRGSTATKFSYEAMGYRSHLYGTRSPFDHQNSFENLRRPIQVPHSFSQQYPETYRNLHNASGDGPSNGYPQMVSENYSSIRHSMPFHGQVFVPSGMNRNGGPRILQERRRFLPGDISGPDGSISEGFIVGDQLAIEGFGDMFDQHSDMRLDVDNMAYEELLALGERIGNVCTGLSDDAVLDCLMEVEAMCNSSSDQEQDEETCAICLEEYEKMDSVGKLKGCGHGYHSSCIKKWLSMKNSCPICKAPGLAAENTYGKGEK